MSKSDNRVYSLDGEIFNIDRKQDAIEGLAIGTEYWSAEAHPIGLSTYLDASTILDNARDALAGDVGDSADDSFNVDAQAVKELDDLLAAWLAKHCSGEHYWACDDIQCHTVTAKDIEQISNAARKQSGAAL